VETFLAEREGDKPTWGRNALHLTTDIKRKRSEAPFAGPFRLRDPGQHRATKQLRGKRMRVKGELAREVLAPLPEVLGVVKRAHKASGGS